MSMAKVRLPSMDAQIPDLKKGITRRSIIQQYQSADDDDSVRAVLTQAQIFVMKDQIYRAGADRVILPSLGPLEFAAIAYFDCLKEDNPIRKEFTPEYVAQCLKAARKCKQVSTGYLEQAV